MYNCTLCKIYLNSEAQWEQHLRGSKHMQKEVLARSSPKNAEDSSFIVRGDGSIMCSICPDFTCSGEIPFKQHVDGKKHLKNLSRQMDDSKMRTDCTLPSPMSPRFSQPTINATSHLPEEEQVRRTDFDEGGRLFPNFNKNQSPSPMEIKNEPSPNLTAIPRKDYDDKCFQGKLKALEKLEHPFPCHFKYPPGFEWYSLQEKILTLTPHFIIIQEDDPTPPLPQRL